MPKLADHLTSPPDLGHTDLEFELTVNPVGRQSGNKAEYRAFKEAVASCVRSVQYLLSGDVQLEICWYIHERERYETDRSPDIDNILKPILDGMSGPNGLLIDDCQVQALDCRWIDHTEEDQSLSVRVRFMSDEWVTKEALVFVHLVRSLYFPINLNLPPEVIPILLAMVEKMITARDEVESRTGKYYLAKRLMPIQRVFHKSRLEHFRKVELADLQRKLEKQAKEEE